MISARVDRLRGFDLDAETALAVVEDEVVAVAIAAGLAKFQSEDFGFVEKGGFGQLSDTFSVGTFALRPGFERRETWGTRLRGGVEGAYR